MTFSQLLPGNTIHVLEITGTFKKNTTYGLGNIISVSKPYDEPMSPQQFPMAMQNRRKLVDLIISCDGEQKKVSVAEDKSIMTDNSIGLTLAIEKNQIIEMVRQSYRDCKIKKESVAKYDEEMRRCEQILKLLDSDISTDVTKDFKEFDELKKDVKELKALLLDKRKSTENVSNDSIFNQQEELENNEI